ncbi:phosphofurin acidic cluster sorting protein 2 isoform X2 [Leptopilina heterotoma]|uniref:phosphofurin acidic cluster sorting protein 2 isoform X2 n=1 Tax=Leptopilina heterotoma TaxID=63436 RepID=UPI001CA7CEC9|nr:phosphofurin acidic cluster sorting protein 2 isoform X2 [Leptopilina heterotoma]
MAERTKTAAPANRPVPMKLFATWEVDRTPPNCIPRLCSLTLSRLVILQPLGSELASISIAVKMQSSKRTLRSNEMTIPPGGILDTELELQFALQYPHFLKRDGNKLLILLQRRKRYKNRTMLGYKTLAEGVINMAQVLQKQMDLELDLVSDKAEKYGGHSVVLARVIVVALSSQPVDHDKRLMNDPNERLCQEFSDEEEEFSSEGEAEGSDSEPTLEVHRRKSRGKIPANARQRNLKQKFISLLKRFRVSEEMEHDQEEMGQKLSGERMEIDELFDELEDLSDSGPELDTMSISSTPKPSLRPFFSSSRSLLAPPNAERGVDRQSDDSSRKADSDSHPENCTDHETNDVINIFAGSPPKSEPQNKNDNIERKARLFTRDKSVTNPIKSKKHSLSVDLKPSVDLNNSEPRKALIEQQFNRVLPDDGLPDALSLVSLADTGGAGLATRLQERIPLVLTTASPADIRGTLTCLATRIQKFCNSSAKPPGPIKIVIAGGDSFVNTVLKHYVDLLSYKPPDWQNYLRFLVVPLGYNSLAKYLASIDSKYASLFGDDWKEMIDRDGGGNSEVSTRVAEYISSAGLTLLLPIAEAMVAYRETDDSSQIFIPFVNDVRVGCPDSSSSTSVDLEEGGTTMSGSPPSLPTPGAQVPPPSRLTPPSSPNVGQPREGWEPVEMQLDYWGKLSLGEKGKNTLRQAFRALHVQRLPALGESPGNNLSMSYTIKEKKQKIMRLGKKKEKEKENEPKSQSVDGVTRLICSAKTHVPLKVSIDGTDWYGVKFFKLSAQWQTHIKTFPIALFVYHSQQQNLNST